MLEKIVSKLFSGKFLLTIIGGAVFYKVATTGVLPIAATSSILTAIFTAYFYQKNGNKPDEKTKP